MAVNSEHTEQGVLEHSVWLNPIQRGLKQTFFLELVVVIVRDSTKFLGLESPISARILGLSVSQALTSSLRKSR